MKLLYTLSLFLVIESICIPAFSADDKTRNDSILAESYVSYSDTLNAKTKYDSAIIYLQMASDIFKKQENWKRYSHCEMWKTYTYVDMGEFDMAIAVMDSCITFFDSFLPPYNQFSYICTAKKSVAYYVQNKYDSCIKIMTEAVYKYKQNPDIEDSEHQSYLATGYMELANSYIDTRMLDSASYLYKKVLEIREKNKENNASLLSDCYNNLGIIYVYQGDFETSLTYMQKALDLREEYYGFAHTLTAWSYTNIAITKLYLNEYTSALEYAFKGLESRKQSLPPEHLAFSSSYSVIANIYNETGDYDEALKYHNLALDVYNKVLGENSPRAAKMYNNIGDLYNKQEKYDTACGYFKKAYELIIENYPDKKISSAVLYSFNIADNYLKMNEIDSAFKYNSTATEINFSNVSEQNQIDAILDFYAARMLYEQRESLYLIKYKQNHSFDELEHTFNICLEHIELMDYMRKSATGLDSKLLLIEENSIVIGTAINCAYMLNKYKPEEYPADIINKLIEKSKAGVLEELTVKAGGQVQHTIPDSLSNQWKELMSNVLTLKTEKTLLLEKGNDTDIREINNKIFTEQKKLAELNDYLSDTYPAYQEINLNQTPGFMNGKNTPENEVMLNYYVSDSLLFIYAITGKEHHLRTVAIDSTLEKTTISYLRNIKKTRIHEFGDQSEQLYQILIHPVADLISNKDKLIIIPDKFLYYLPFETLCEGDVSNDFTKNNYLIKSHDIIYHYSASLYNRYSGNAKNEAPISFTGFAPVFDSENTPTNIQDNLYASISDTSLENSGEVLRAISVNGKTYNELPYSEKEVNEIVNMFKKMNYPARGFLHKDASENTFKQEVAGAKFIHLASHGIINENNPQLSGIIFSPSGNASETLTESSEINPPEDIDVLNSEGILFAGEMYDLELHADLVVLSACETGLGKVINGEGVMSMTRGFIYSGTPNILFSLWKIDDKRTCDLMIDFYKNLLQGNTYSESLRKAKLAFINHGETAFPKYWSGFTLVGIN